MIVIGIDPGSINCGFGIVQYKDRKFTLLEYGVIHAKKINEEMPLRLKEIFERLDKIVKRNNTDEAAFESLFFSKNVQSLIKLSHARAAAVLSASVNNVPVFEYAPNEVKKSVTGRGKASKEQVQFMVKNMLKIEETPDFFDATDALAVAICHCLRRNELGSNKIKSWKEYAKAKNLI